MPCVGKSRGCAGAGAGDGLHGMHMTAGLPLSSGMAAGMAAAAACPAYSSSEFVLKAVCAEKIRIKPAGYNEVRYNSIGNQTRRVYLHNYRHRLVPPSHLSLSLSSSV